MRVSAGDHRFAPTLPSLLEELGPESDEEQDRDRLLLRGSEATHWRDDSSPVGDCTHVGAGKINTADPSVTAIWGSAQAPRAKCGRDVAPRSWARPMRELDSWPAVALVGTRVPREAVVGDLVVYRVLLSFGFDP